MRSVPDARPARCGACAPSGVPEPSVLLATCAQLPEGAEDEWPLLPALARHGIDARFAVWDDPSVDWEAAGLVVVRSTWDYTDRRDAFLAWAGGLPRLRNPAAVLRWNTDKRYLDDLLHAGLPVVPTAFVTPGGPRPPLRGEVVVKPSVSAGSRDTARFGPASRREAHVHLTALLEAGRPAMVQPYVSSVDARGESALLYLGGEYSHSIRKGAILPSDGGAPRLTEYEGGLFATEDISPREPTEAERATADAVVDHLHARFGTLLYARIDLVEDERGTPQVLEVELTEPSLFLSQSPSAPARLAQAVEHALTG